MSDCADCPDKPDEIAYADAYTLHARELELMRRDIRKLHSEMAASFAIVAGMLTLIYWSVTK